VNENSGRAWSDRGSLDARLGIAERALNDPRKSTATPEKHEKSQQKNREENNDKRRHKNLTRDMLRF
jgi:Zn-finger nucleic acid-binding protein